MSSFTRSLRFERNTKTVPLNGSCCRIDCTVRARPSAPRRKSTGRVATSTRTPGGRLPDRAEIMSSSADERSCRETPARRPHRRAAQRRQSRFRSPHCAKQRRPALLQQVLRFTQVLAVQISHTAACNAHHDLQERLARWLLMAHDRAESDALPLTQEFMSMMLAVRRPGVTVAARSLQDTGAIDYERGRILVRDRARLEEASCECYGIVREHYRRMLGWPAGGTRASMTTGSRAP